MKVVAVVAALAAILVASTAQAGISEGVVLRPLGSSGVTGKVIVSSPDDRAAAAVGVTVRGLRPGASARLVLNAIEQGKVGASTVVVASGRANAKGVLVAKGRVVYRGEPVTFSSIADGAHAFTVVAGGKAVARGVLPGMD